MLYNVEGMARFGVTSSSEGHRFVDCTKVECERHGDWFAVELNGGPMEGPAGEEWTRSIQLMPVDQSQTSKVEITAVVEAGSPAEAEAKLPSVETLTDLALDERLAPPTATD